MEKGSKGSALVVTAMVVLMAGLIGLSLLYSLQSATREKQEEQTAVKMHHLIHALSGYYQRYSRVPCPADPDTAAVNPPFGAERGSGVDGTAVGDCPLVAEEDGIVPFKTLGLNEDDIRDAWGRYFTYHVNQSSSWSAAEAAQYIAAYPSVKVIDLCRLKKIWVAPGGLHDNYYPQQALACCLDPAASIRIVNGSGADVTGLPSVTPDRFAPQKDPALPSSISHPIHCRTRPPSFSSAMAATAWALILAPAPIQDRLSAAHRRARSPMPPETQAIRSSSTCQGRNRRPVISTTSSCLKRCLPFMRKPAVTAAVIAVLLPVVLLCRRPRNREHQDLNGNPCP